MLRSRIDSLRQRGSRYWGRFDPATRALPGYLGRAIANFNRHGLRQAAALAYYAVFSIFPLSLLLAVGIGSVLGPTVAEEQIARGLSLFLPDQTLELFQRNMATTLEQGRSFGLIAVAGLIWAGLGLFTNVTNSLDLIFLAPSSRSLWRQRLVALAMALALVTLIFTSFLTSGILRLVVALTLDRPNPWLLIGTYSLPFAIDMIIFALLFRYVPARYVKWDAVWPGAIMGAAGWELLKLFFNWYLDNVATFQFVYGSIATVIVLLFWVYLLASIFLLSAELSAQLNEWMFDQQKKRENERFIQSTPLSELPDVDGESPVNALQPGEQRALPQPQPELE
jgi:membrane protein